MDDKTFKQLEGQLTIDVTDLDQEVIAQPERHYHASIAAAHAKDEADQAYTAMKEAEAVAWLDVKERLEGEKQRATEALIKAEVALHSEYSKARHEYHQAKRRSDEYQALKESYIQRSYMIRELVELYVSGYMGQESAGKANNHVEEHRAQQAREAMSKKRRERHQNRRPTIA